MKKIWRAFVNIVNVGWIIVKATALLAMILTISGASNTTIYVIDALYFIAMGAFLVFVFGLTIRIFKK